MKRLVLLFAIVFFTFIKFPIIANADEITILADEATVGNIYWEIKDENRITIPDGTKVDVVDAEGNIIKSTVVEDGYIFIKNIPFGDYSVVIDNDKSKIIPVTLNKESLDNQHIKQIKIIGDVKEDLESDSVKTGDSNKTFPIIVWLIASGFILLFFKSSFRKEV